MNNKDMPHLPGIYRIYFTTKSYIGAAIDIKNRIQKHKSYLRRGVHSNQKLQRAYNLHPKDLKIEILEILNTVDREKLLDVETYYHYKYDSIENGYNIGLPRKIQEKFTLTTIQIKKANSKSCKPIYVFNRFTGKLCYEYDSISVASKELNIESTNISSACKGRLNYCNNYIFCYKKDFDNTKIYKFDRHYKKGTKISNEYKEKMRKSSGKAIKVVVYNSNNIFIEEVSSIRFCEEKYGFKYDMLRYKLDKNILVNGFYFKRKLN